MKKLSILFLLALMAFGQQAWADNVTLSVDPDIPEGTAGHWYVNMPSDGEVYLTLNAQDLLDGKNVFKVYDDGGKNGNYTSGCLGKMVINVPDGYLIQISGTVWTYYETTIEYLNVYDGDYDHYAGSIPTNLLAKVYSPTDGEATDFGPLNTTGNAMYLYFRSRQYQTTTFQGLDLTVTVYENAYYNITVAEGIEHGNITPSPTSAHFNDAVTLTVTPAENYYIGTVTWNDGTTDHVITPTDNGVYSFNMPQHDVTVSATFLDDVGHFWGEGNEGSEALPYVISDKDGWDLLIAKSTSSNNIAQNKYFELTTDISGVTQSVLFFGGHLDGKGHKITLAMDGNNSHGYGLIWRVDNPCSISNLTVDGSIANQEQYVGGFFAQASLPVTFTNCRSSVDITSSYSGDTFRGGGFVGFTGGHSISVDRCAFDGTFSSSNSLSFSPWVGGIHHQVTNSAYLYGGEAHFYNGVGYSDLSAYRLTLPSPAIAVRTGGTVIGNGTGTVYNIGGSPLDGGFTLDGVEYYWNGATVTFGVPELVIAAAVYQPLNSGNISATINADGTACFPMPSANTTVTITGYAAHYIDADGLEQTHAVSLLSSSDVAVTKAGGWYAVTGEVTLGKGLVFSGAAHLILCDGATLNVNHGESSINIAIEATDLSVYGQTLGTGTLNANSYQYQSQEMFLPNYAYSIKASGDITLCGGQVNAMSTGRRTGNYGAIVICYAIHAEGSVSVIRGNHSAIAVLEVGAYGNIYNIWADGEVHLDWRRPTDRICLTFASSDDSYLSRVNVAQGKSLWNGTEVLSGIIWNGGKYSNVLEKLRGKTLQPCIAREVAGYGTNNGGWAFIASPVTGSINPTPVGNLVASTPSEYDLYRFDQSAAKEWENYKVHTSYFVLENGKGYLCARKDSQTLAFMGDAFNTGAEPVEVPLAYDADAELAGWNLVGNPFTVAAYVNKPYYTLNSDGSAILTTTSEAAIPPCYGVIVEVDGSETITFNTSGEFSAGPNNGSLKIALSQANTRSNAVMDNAIVSFNEGVELGKFYFGKQNANIYIPQGGKEYAIASVGYGRDGVHTVSTNEMPLNFKAKADGTYTISVNPEGIEMAYLHLVDNMTGNDIDLLAGASTGSATYTFTAKTTDYESRFRLVFATNNEDGPSTGSGTFAFFSNGNWIIANEGKATLQVIDINGRILTNETVNGSVSKAINAAPGVYVIRLINGNDVKTQKIVVR